MTLRNLAIAFVVLIAAIAVTGTPSGSEAARQGISKMRVACEAQPRRVTAAGGRAVAGADYSCDRPGPQRLSMTVRLERSGDGRQWTPVASQTVTAAGLDTTAERTAAQRRHEVSAACTSASWRSTVELSYEYKGATKQQPARSSEPRRGLC
jgi:hypothetical protein